MRYWLAAALLALAPTAFAQDGAPLDLMDVPAAILVAADRLDAATDPEERTAAEAELAALCGRTAYPDVAICVDIMRNERRVVRSTARCVMHAGRAWNCANTEDFGFTQRR